MSNRPLPNSSPWSEPFWEAARNNKLVVQTCEDCSVLRMYPTRLCPSCLGENLGWVESAGTGELYTFTVQVAGPPSGFEDMVPYVIAVIRLDEGVQMMSNIVGPNAAEARCGDRVTVKFQPPAETGTVLPVFTLDRFAPSVSHG